jgi:hypothetical protein
MLLLLAIGSTLAAPIPVTVKRNPDGSYNLLRDGAPYFIQGAGGLNNLDRLATAGANSVRTWGIQTLAMKIDGKPFLDRAHELGLSVCVGIWVNHENHGFNYRDQAAMILQREEVRRAVRKYRDHPAILMWGLGNEAEGPTSDDSDPGIWQELNELAAIVKQEDPLHPVMTVIAGDNPVKIRKILQYYPNIDILGVNAYATASGTPETLRTANWIKPFVLAEFGPIGNWEARLTSWGAPVEQTSREKAAMYYSTYNSVIAKSDGKCLGSYAFIWGHKQEATATWYGMMLKGGEKLPPLDIMTLAWSGAWPSNRCPRVEKFETPLREATVKPGSRSTAMIDVVDPEEDSVTYDWTVVSEGISKMFGTTREPVPASHPESVISTSANTAEIRAPQTPGAYRLFITVRDGKGGASVENVPFLVAN